jgi:DNA-binding MarR family transcriptional regulator
MNQKQIGKIIIILGILLFVFLFYIKAQEDQYIQVIIDDQGSCYLDDGTCLHDDRDFTLFYVGGALAVLLLSLGIYLIYFDKTQKLLLQQHKEVSSALKVSKEKDEFNAFVSGFGEPEQRILKAVHDQEGIKQSTLRYKTGMSKTSLSLILKHLEERDIISRKESGKTKEIFLKKKF